MLRAILNKSWKQHPTKQKLFSDLPPIMKTIQIRWTRHAGHCWKRKDELISNILLLTPSKVGRPARTYIQQFCANTGCSLEDLLGVIGNRDWWWERVREIHASSVTWYIYICMYIYIFKEEARIHARIFDWYCHIKKGSDKTPASSSIRKKTETVKKLHSLVNADRRVLW